MYFKRDNKFFHGIMFHHFHDDRIHKKSQGSLSQDDLYKMINFIGRKNILDADIFYEKHKSKTLQENDVCLTFDDGIKSQIDIALPVIEDFKIKSFFFVYTSIFEGQPDNIEVYRYFRTNYFSTINEFYKKFYIYLDNDLKNFFYLNKNKIKSIKTKFPFYTEEDIKFRLTRDHYLSKNQYDNIMLKMISDKKFNFRESYSNLFFNYNDLKQLDDLGHLVGLHTHNHPTMLEKLNYTEQKYEYEHSLSLIAKILEKSINDIKFMSHPSGSYNNDTLKILNDLGIDLGFKQIMSLESDKGMKKINNSLLEIARQDHAQIYNRMNQ